MNDQAVDLQKTTSRLLGVYPQRQQGLFMQRIKILGGRINWPQWRQVALLTEKYSRGFPLHITTRQDIELHNIPGKDIPAVQQNLAEVGLMTFGACGDTVRNVTVCTACDFCPQGLDLLPLAYLIRQYIEHHPLILTLPRKFKISFSGCQKACAKPYLNDLAFVAQPDRKFTAIGAGSLGPRPSLSIELYKDLPPADILPLCIASVEFFAQYGDRENKHKARLRHIREKFSDDTFKAMLDEHFNQVKARQPWPQLLPASGQQNASLLSRLQLPCGNIAPQQALKLAAAAEPKSATLRINLEHGLELYGSQPVQLPDDLSVFANNPVIIACPGSVTCSKGLADCWALAELLKKTLADCNLSNLLISISGCPNNCAHSAVADIGLVGILRKENNQSTQQFRIFVGGGNGKNDRLAQQFSVVKAGDVPNAIHNLLNNPQNPCSNFAKAL